MSEKNSGRIKNTPIEDRTADRADGRDTTEQTGSQKTDSRGTASRQQRTLTGQCASDIRKSTDVSSSYNTDDPVLACPECDSTGVRSMVQNGRGGPTHDNDFCCRHCGATFDNPVRRERSVSPGDPGYLAGQLAKADPDDVGRLVTDGGQYQATTREITAVDGVSVDITVRGDEDRAEKVAMDLRERIGKLGAAYDAATPPSELDEVPSKYTPIMTVAWDRVFEDDEEIVTDGGLNTDQQIASRLRDLADDVEVHGLDGHDIAVDGNEATIAETLALDDDRDVCTDGGWPEGDACISCGEPMDVGAVGNPGETITWQECKDCGIGWGPFTGYVDTDDEEPPVATDGGTEQAPKRSDVAGKWAVWCADCGAKNHQHASECSACGYGSGQGTFGVGTWRNVGAPEYTSDGKAGRFDRSADTDDGPEVRTDGGQLQTRPAPDAADPLTRFQLEMLYVLAAKRDQSDYGLGIKSSLEGYYDETVNHGRLYPNLDDLVERGLVEKTAQDKRTNTYALTPAGKELVVEDATRRDATADDLLEGGR